MKPCCDASIGNPQHAARHSGDQRRRRAGFTLIELTVALALAALLFAALVGVARVAQQQAQLVERRLQPRWKQATLQLLYRDLLSAQRVWSRPGELSMRGNFIQPLSSGEEASTVTYRLQNLGERGLLVRVADDVAECVALDLRRVVVERIDSAGDPQPLPSSPGPVPARVRVWLWTGDLESSPMMQDLVIW